MRSARRYGGGFSNLPSLRTGGALCGTDREWTWTSSGFVTAHAEAFALRPSNAAPRSVKKGCALQAKGIRRKRCGFMADMPAKKIYTLKMNTASVTRCSACLHPVRSAWIETSTSAGSWRLTSSLETVHILQLVESDRKFSRLGRT